MEKEPLIDRGQQSVDRIPISIGQADRINLVAGGFAQRSTIET